MASPQWFKGYVIYGIVLLIAFLLFGNIYLIYRNSQVIEYNKNQYEKAEQIKVNTVEVIRNLHLLDMSLRSYVLVKQPKYLVIADSCITRKHLIFDKLEKELSGQNYPMQNFYVMKHSVNAYYKVIDRMKESLMKGQFDLFIRLLEPDPGYNAWETFTPFSDNVNAFETQISESAQAQYQRALRNSYLLQIVLFLIAIPTLSYTAYYTTTVLNLSEQLRRSNEENYKIVTEQNTRLEQMVQERTKEILLQNEKITAQHEEIALHNEQLILQQREIELHRNELRDHNGALQEAKRIIEAQNIQIQIKHDHLAIEVDKQTQNLKKTNLELIEHNSRLEQFAYIISHNLRAPVARLNGLAFVLDHARTGEEASNIIRMMIKSTGELDHVIKDLGVILALQKPGAQLTAEVNLASTIDKAVAMLGFEIKESGARLHKDFIVERFQSLPPYIESILYNLISNSIKYRHPDRPPVIRVQSKQENGHIRIDVSDNGLGIDLEQNKDNLFNLYKRFHFHIEGKGLGLYLVKTQVNALGGKIEVRSKMYQGTTFTIFLKSN